ncbi:bacterial regulatory s, luxR family protein [Escherichia coli 5-172-05_S4_C1]|uniref:LuxR C-terminal-related transcriptional regulator n=1 Tax=Escherichia coli TaxID=562 RepID=UPI0004D71038|nr:LuxR C-terminal-related transcriptional regulator [Escherichia coli]KEL36204.1 bacterial regulatory s, luxR family protein [Escherichia coli 5-172-05_S4_C1]NZA66928.1 LuxR family transcriptional regulator [Escherichia coli]
MLDIKNEYFTLSVDLSDCTLTPKEKEVIRLLLAGYDVMAIGRMKQRSVKTVSSQKLSAYKKLGVRGDITLFPDLIQRRGMQGICRTDGYLSTPDNINISADQVG